MGNAWIASDEWEAVLEARAFAYRMLANAFLAEPVREQVAALAETGAVDLFPYAADSELVAQGIAEAAAYLKDPANGTDAAFDALRWDYTRLFIGPGKLAAPPWESAYSNEDRLLFQEQTLAVRKVFRQYGLVPATAPTNPEDHMGLELEFLYHTTCLALERAKAGDLTGQQPAQAGSVADLRQVLRDQQAFLNEHLLTWAPDFADDVVKSSATGFYRGMARMLSGFLRVDRAVLDELVGSLK